MRMSKPGLAFCALAAMSSFANLAAAQQIQSIGDVPGATAGLLVSPVNSTNTQAFSYVSGLGTIVGDVIVTNNATGTAFDMTITNLTFTCIVPNSANAGDVTLVVDHHYTIGGAGPYTAAHSISGSWTSGPGSAVQLDGTQGVGAPTVALPSLATFVTPFSLGPATAAVPSGTAPQYVIQAVLRLHTDSTGAIILPSSAHVSVTMVPEPTTVVALAAASVALLRRRR
jgi:hypothetical protein